MTSDEELRLQCVGLANNDLNLARKIYNFVKNRKDEEDIEEIEVIDTTPIHTPHELIRPS